MFLDILLTIIFIVGVIYLIHYRLNIKKAAVYSCDALYPKTEDEFKTILVPTEYKEMKHLSKKTKSYQYVKWGTVLGFIIIFVLFVFYLTTDNIEPSFFNIVYLFVVVISAIKHPGNLYILPKGIILNGKYYSSNQIRTFETEQIIKWHELYGLDKRLNYSYKLTIKVKSLLQPNFVVIEDLDHLGKITHLLKHLGIHGQEKSAVTNAINEKLSK